MRLRPRLHHRIRPTVERPDFSVKIPRIDPPSRGEYDFQSDDHQDSEGGVTICMVTS